MSEHCTECNNVLWAPRSIESGLCSACHPDGPSVHPNWDSLDVDAVAAVMVGEAP